MLLNRRTRANKQVNEENMSSITEKNSLASVSARSLAASAQRLKAPAAETEFDSYKNITVYSLSNAIGVTNGRRKVLVEKLKDKKYRDSYVRATISHGIAHQVRVNRELRKLSQKALAEKCGSRTTQVAISRLEDPSNEGFTLNTILKVASALDVAVLVRFVPYSKFLLETADKSVNGLFSKSFQDENLQTKQALITLDISDDTQQATTYISLQETKPSPVFKLITERQEQACPSFGYTFLATDNLF